MPDADGTPVREGGPGPGGDAWVGKRLGKFRLLRRLGEGTAGIVFQAEDTHLRRVVALKVMRRPGGLLHGDARVAQFLREARAAAKLEHLHVARIHEIDRTAGWWYIATEYLEGGSLRQLVRAAGLLPPERACPVLADAAAALLAAHQRGMIHRDVKPANLMLTRTCRAKLVDFGLVRLADPADPDEREAAALGTPHYLAPELAQRGAVSAAADVYSLGATMHFVLTGRPPFEAESLEGVIAKHAAAPRPDLRAAAPACSEALAGLFERMMAVDARDRPAMEEVGALLRVESIGLDAADTELMLVLPGEGSGPLPTGAAFAPAGARAVTAAGPPLGPGLLTGGAGGWWLPANRPRRRLAAAVLVLLLLGLSVLAWRGTEVHPGDATARGREAFAARFPDAPEGYGLRAPGQTLDPDAALEPADPPPFSWLVGGPDTPDAAWVSHEAGRRFYRRDDPRAALIPAGSAVFFETAGEAQRAGRVRAEEQDASQDRPGHRADPGGGAKPSWR
ncbi:putative serine/threonine protein kinase [Phycisphaera mikurensis NBRC 102666]|uniref:Putative serine/threonine protein kinase n=1 Tax=Phycisphaera mikurensis (strain NBRC 102666 / KCTC 22515 / FYK2301M01) TaxID=1142394 RepID=I0IHQ0_PHYMF|nr:putative serine/threonine protein kinase [Phycisphaera mikurensis NBRC 102666]